MEQLCRGNQRDKGCFARGEGERGAGTETGDPYFTAHFIHATQRTENEWETEKRKIPETKYTVNVR